VATIVIFPAQTRAAGQYVSASASYTNKTLACMLEIIDSNWGSEPTTLIVGLFGEESFDSGTIWLNAIGPYDFTGSKDGGKTGIPSAGFLAGNDGAGDRLVRATLTLNQTWTGAVNLVIQ
jgi:hypothetical protein